MATILVLASALAAGAPCATDADCPFGGAAWRCCGTGLAPSVGENCAKVSAPPAPGAGGNCTLPGSTGATRCACRAPPSCGMDKPYPPAGAGQAQWLMIGDSISYGCLGPAKAAAAARGIEVTHNPTNAANVWWGAHCLDAWLGADAGRWDAISFQFGLHDLALDNERLEPAGVYRGLLANITQRLADAAPRAKLLWVTTTPVPRGIGGYCNKTTGQGGCPPRRAADPPLYNAAAAEAVASVPAAPRVATLDLYRTVTDKCGVSYDRCPEGCTGQKVNGTWVGDCYQIPLNVHFFPAAWQQLGGAYVDAIGALLGRSGKSRDQQK
jgi:hypothetical protein